MIRNKYIILPFLLLSWTIIFVHSIIPHQHHHLDEEGIEISNYSFQCDCLHHNNLLDIKQIWNNDNDSRDHECHFHVEVLTQVSIDNVFIANTENTFISQPLFLGIYNSCFEKRFISTLITKTNYLRGPPQKLFS